MKKILLFLILFLFPINVFADGTDKYYIEANVLSNGDMEVKELKILEGTYNGIETILRFDNNDKLFTGIKSDFGGSSIYNASNLVDLRVYGVNYDSKDYSLINSQNKTEFDLVYDANASEYGVYTNYYNNLKIFMPSSYRQASLVTYTLKDVVVIHNDVAEIAWDFIGNDYKEVINELIIKINLPDNSNELRVFSHGPLTGINSINSKKQVEASYTNFGPNRAIDVRVVFDKEVVPFATKKSNIDGLSNILDYEKEMANKANQQREEAQKMVDYASWYTILSSAFFIIMGIFYYLKYDKEVKTNFNSEYNREFIEDYNVEVIDYLMKKEITPNAMSSSIMNLVYKKIIKVEKFNENLKKSMYVFTKLGDSDNESEKILLKFLFDKVGNGTSFTDYDLKEYAKSTKTYKEFNNSYTNWKDSVKSVGEAQNFWEEGKKFFIIAIALTSIMVMFFFAQPVGWIPLLIIGIAFHIIFIVYVLSSRKRTAHGADHYAKWNAFKNFLNDFGRFQEKELPEIILWERYLVYATIFGLANKVQKAMNVKIQEMHYENSTIGGFNYFDYIMINNMINRSVNTAVRSATQTAAQVAASQRASSGGFGGGSSFGGGGFGGGGSGGGRF